METWMIHALIGSLLTWLFWVFQKIETETPELKRETFIFYSYVLGAFFNLAVFSFLDIDFVWNTTAVVAGTLVTCLYVYVLRLRHNCLKYMSSSAYFINYRIFTSIWLLLVGSIIFSEYISLREYMWVFLWFIIFYLLIEKKNTTQTKTDLKKWYAYLGISIVLAITIWVVQKNFSLTLESVWLFLFATSISGVCFSLLTSPNHDYKSTLTIPSLKYFFFLLLVWITFGPGYIFHLYAIFEWWDIAIIYKIISYWLFFPIIFSILYYKEPLTPKKIIAFILTVVSIWLFI